MHVDYAVENFQNILNNVITLTPPKSSAIDF